MRGIGLKNRALVPAIDVDVGAADEFGAARRQEGDGICHIPARTPAAERNVRAPFSLLLLEVAVVIDFVMEREAVSQRALDTARAHGIDEDLVRRQLVR